MKKLEKILKLSAYTLLCTSSIMAAFGENMAAGVGVTVGTSVQEQTYLDNNTDGSSGPLAGVHGNALMRFADNGSSVTMFDIKTAAYPRLDTYSGGLGLVYRMKTAGGLGQGFSAAVDYTRYDSMDAWQAALGHETMLSGFDSRLNVYIPFGDTYTYDAMSGSKLTTMLGADWTLSKAIDAVNLGGHMSYFYNDDVKDNIFALGLVGDYTFDKSVTIGAGIQWRDGLDSADWGYRGFAAVPLFKGQTSSKNMEMYRPVARMLGAVIQAEEEDCSGQPGTESYARYGLTVCQALNPFDGAQLQSGAFVPKDALGVAELREMIDRDGMKVREGKKFHLKKGKMAFIDEPVIVDELEIEEKTMVSFGRFGAIVTLSSKSDGTDVKIGKGDFAETNHPVIMTSHDHTFRGDKGKFTAAMKFHGGDRVRTGPLVDESVLDRMDSRENILGLVILGKGDLNYAAATEFDTEEKGHILGSHGVWTGFEVATAATTDAGANKGKLKADATGIARKLGKKFKEFEIGGGTASTALNKIDKLVAHGIPFRAVGSDLDVKNSRFGVGRHGGIHQRGGKLSLEASTVFAMHRNSDTLLDLDGGGLSQLNGNTINGARLPADRHHIKLRNHSQFGGTGTGTTADDYNGTTGLLSFRNHFVGQESEGASMINFHNGASSGGFLSSYGDGFELRATLAKIGGAAEEAIIHTAGSRLPAHDSSYVFEPSDTEIDDSSATDKRPLKALRQKNNATAASTSSAARFLAVSTTIITPDHFRDRPNREGPLGNGDIDLTFSDATNVITADASEGTPAEVGHAVGAFFGNIDEWAIMDAALVGTAAGAGQKGPLESLGADFGDQLAITDNSAGGEADPGMFDNAAGGTGTSPMLVKKADALTAVTGAPTEIANAQFKTSKHNIGIAVPKIEKAKGAVKDIDLFAADAVTTTRPLAGRATTDQHFVRLNKIVGNDESQMAFLVHAASNGRGSKDFQEEIRKDAIAYDDARYTNWLKLGKTIHDETHDTVDKLAKKRMHNRYKVYPNNS